MDIGQALHRLRIQRNLTQEELADRCELSKGFISQLERNLTSPSIATLTDLLECLGSSLRAFFAESAEEKIVFSQSAMFEKADEGELRGKLTWLVPNAQKNQMEPILVDLGPRGKTHLIPPHDGEEIGYVLSGSIELVHGGQVYRVRRGESFCLHPQENHFIRNPLGRSARFLWVSSPPSF